jgi:hypothetical protein
MPTPSMHGFSLGWYLYNPLPMQLLDLVHEYSERVAAEAAVLDVARCERVHIVAR